MSSDAPADAAIVEAVARHPSAYRRRRGARRARSRRRSRSWPRRRRCRSDRVAAVVAAGVVDVGENRAQELTAKAPALEGTGARWHFLGQLQRNKVRTLAPWVVCWQSVDRDQLGAEIARRAPGARVLVEVNLAGEAAKGGCQPSGAPGLVDSLRATGLDVAGLMAVPPADDDPRRWFARLRELGAHLGLAELSMGMSGDFEIAVEEGATMVRVGRALFGARS